MITEHGDHRDQLQHKYVHHSSSSYVHAFRQGCLWSSRFISAILLSQQAIRHHEKIPRINKPLSIAIVCSSCSRLRETPPIDRRRFLL
jgi:hypothetical protein